MRKTCIMLSVALTCLIGGGVARGQALVGGQPNPDYMPLHAWYDVNQSLGVWEGRTDQYDDEFLVDVRDTATGSGAHRGNSYPTNAETWAQFDESGGTFWPARVGGFTGTQNGMTTWEVRNAAGWDDDNNWSDADGVGSGGIGLGHGYTIMWAMSIYDVVSYNSVWNGDPAQTNDDTPMLNGSTGAWNLGATAGAEPGKALLWLDSQRTGYAGPVWVMDNGAEMVAGEVTLDQWQIHTFEFNVDGTGTSKHYIDGVEVASGDAGIFSMDVLQLWSSDGGWHRGGNFDFAEGLFYDEILASADRSGLETYLYSKWVSAPSVDGDFNDDGMFDCSDIDALVGEIVAGTNTASYDMNGDGFVDGADQDQWLADAATANGLGSPYKPGDANLNGSVDVSDFNVWNGHKFTNDPGWCAGDFNHDGSVDVSDFNAWNGTKFTSSVNVGAVPEPASAILTLLALAVTLGAFRRS